MNEKGFTLIELMITVAIIGILAMIAVPMYVGQTKKAARTEAFTNLQNIRLLEEQFFAENGSYVAGADTAGIMTSLTRFQPGSNLGYDYVITNSAGVSLPNPVPFPYTSGTTALVPATTPCFIATATGAASRVTGDVYAIDCNNNRNF